MREEVIVCEFGGMDVPRVETLVRAGGGILIGAALTPFTAGHSKLLLIHDQIGTRAYIQKARREEDGSSVRETYPIAWPPKPR